MLNFKITYSERIVMNCDKQSALHIVANLVFHEKRKYLDINYDLVSEK